MRLYLPPFGRGVALILSVALLGALSMPQTVWAETAAQAAKKPVQPPKPYRLPDGHLNWTGFWVPLVGMLQFDIGLGGTPQGAPTGLLGKLPFSQYSELKSPYKEQLEKFQQDMAAGKIVDPLAQCLPPGMPTMMYMIYGMEVLQTPGQVTMTSEWDSETRRVWLNQKEHTSLEELDPSYTGESIGHWQGDTLIVDTIGVRREVLLNNAGLPHSDKMRLVETFTETKPGILEDKVVIDDPDVFAAPWTQTLTYRYRPDLRIKEYECLENNRNVGPNGQATFDK